MLQMHAAVYLQTDYTSFEALFTREHMLACEMVLYEYMSRNCPGGREWYKEVEATLTGKNVCVFSQLGVEIPATRMSGEMCTSLGNGFSNLMFMLYTIHRLGGDFRKVRGVVEGDDGLFVAPRALVPSKQQFEELGLKIKLEPYDDYARASFCGLVFVPEDLINVTNPLKVLATTGWCPSLDAMSGSKKKATLLRAKGMSIIAQYPGCPILHSFGRYICRVTRSYDVRRLLNDRNTSWWDREKLLDLLSTKVDVINPVKIPMATRRLMEVEFGVSVEIQERLEKYFDGLEDLEPIEPELLEHLLPREWKVQWDTYVQDFYQGEYIGPRDAHLVDVPDDLPEFVV